MECISCKKEQRLHLWHRLLLCDSCKALAEKAEKDIEKRIDAAKLASRMWLEEYVCEGKLLIAGSGIKVEVVKS